MVGEEVAAELAYDSERERRHGGKKIKNKDSLEIWVVLRKGPFLTLY